MVFLIGKRESNKETSDFFCYAHVAHSCHPMYTMQPNPNEQAKG